jgi:hypothetical protein
MKAKKLWNIIIEELFRSIFTIGVPLAVTYFTNRNRKTSSPDKETVDDVKFNFQTNHDWDSRQSPKED